jgi:hypothetical protein
MSILCANWLSKLLNPPLRALLFRDTNCLIRIHRRIERRDDPLQIFKRKLLPDAYFPADELNVESIGQLESQRVAKCLRDRHLTLSRKLHRHRHGDFLS